MERQKWDWKEKHRKSVERETGKRNTVLINYQAFMCQTERLISPYRQKKSIMTWVDLVTQEHGNVVSPSFVFLENYCVVNCEHR